jgi:hypothetical protein
MSVNNSNSMSFAGKRAHGKIKSKDLGPKANGLVIFFVTCLENPQHCPVNEMPFNVLEQARRGRQDAGSADQGWA